MGAATRISLAAAVSSLDAVQDAPDDLGEQLLDAARVLGSSNQLVGVLADDGIPAADRAALARRVFGAYSPAAAAVLGEVATGRWSEPSGLVSAVEELGYRALAAPASADGLDADLFQVIRTVSSDGRLELAVGNSAAPAAARLALVDRLLADARPAVLAVVRHVVQAPRGRRPVEALEQAQSVVAAARDRLVAVVETATPLTADQQRELSARLQSGYGRKIAINQVVDPALLGGVRITVGDDVIDGSVRARLDDLRLRLAG